MSGPSRIRDIGRKWKSGTSKRKRKADEAKENEVMSSNMMKFFKKPASCITTTNLDESIPQTEVQTQNSFENISDISVSENKEVSNQLSITNLEESVPEIEKRKQNSTANIAPFIVSKIKEVTTTGLED